MAIQNEKINHIYPNSIYVPTSIYFVHVCRYYREIKTSFLKILAEFTYLYTVCLLNNRMKFSTYFVVMLYVG